MPSLTSTFLGRALLWNLPTNRDHLRFPSIPLAPSTAPAGLPAASNPIAPTSVALRRGKETVQTDFDQLLERSGTTAFLVLRHGQKVYERYPNGGAPDRVNRCFSVTKSFASAMVGIALERGELKSLDDPVGAYLPEIDSESMAAITLRQLLTMQSGIGYREGPLPWSDDARCYHSPDCRAAALKARVTDPVGRFFHYNDYHPFLIGMVLERATGEPLDRYFEQRLWAKLAPQYPASLTIDSERKRFVHLESGLNATAADLARFGQLYLEGGHRDGKQIVPQAWVEESTSPAGARTDAAYFDYYRSRPWGRVFASGRYYYKHFWWGYRIDESEHDFFAMGALGQHVYVSPRLGVVIVRLSDRFPKGMWWPPVLRQIAQLAAD